MKSKLIKQLHEVGVFRDPVNKEKLEVCKTSRVIQVYFEKIVNNN